MRSSNPDRHLLDSYARSYTRVRAPTAVRARPPPRDPVQMEALLRKQCSREHPYRAGDTEHHKPCTAADHSGNKKNCTTNPHCLFGLGERKEGIWSAKSALLAGLGEDPALLTRGRKPGESKVVKKDGDAAGKRKTKKAKAAEDDGQVVLVDVEDMSYKEVPMGLANLGATCYLNVLLQNMFFNRRFRKAVYDFTPQDTNTDPNNRVGKMVLILKELQNVFGNMQLGRGRSYNPTEFAKQLCLDRGAQQDPQEFNRLFLQKIEECFGASNLGDSLATQVKGLFRGRQGYVTTCQRCHTASPRFEEFDELELCIEKRRSVVDCLKAHLTPEVLEGDNRYLCSVCASKQDAKRGMQLQSLPPVLTVHLMRYIYDMESGQKKKVKDPIILDETLDFADVLKEFQELPAGALMYDLVGIMYHKGGSAMHGHYVTDVKDTETSKWWTFDDTEVTERDSPGYSDGGESGGVEESKESSGKASSSSSRATGSHVVNKGPVKRPQQRTPARKAATPIVVDDPYSDATMMSEMCEVFSPDSGSGSEMIMSLQPQKKRKKEDAAAAQGSGGGKGSSDAYCLIYYRRNEAIPKEDQLDPPDEVKAKVTAANDTLAQLISNYHEQKRALETAGEQRKRRYEALFTGPPPTATASHNGGQHYWVPTPWLKGWITGVKPPPEERKANAGGAASGGSKGEKQVVDMTEDNQKPLLGDAKIFSETIRLAPYKCLHSDDDGLWRLDPAMVTELKVVKKELWDAFIEDSGPPDHTFEGTSLPIRADDAFYYCPHCVKAYLTEQEALWDKGKKYDTVMRALSKPEPRPSPNDTEQIFILSRRWETAFRKEYEKSCKQLLNGERAQTTLESFYPPISVAEDKADAVKPEPATAAAAAAAPLDVEKEEGVKAGEDMKPSSAAAAQPDVVEIADDGEDEGRAEEKDAKGLDQFVNSNIMCEHDKLVGKGGNRYRLISADCWVAILDAFPDAKAFTADAKPCTQCQQESKEERDRKKELREERKAEVKSRELKTLATRKSCYPSLLRQIADRPEPASHRFKLVDRHWLDRWRTYVNHIEASRPDPPLNTVLLCEHGQVLTPPYLDTFISSEKNELPKPGDGDPLHADPDPVDVVTEVEWQQILESYDETLSSSSKSVTLVVSKEATTEGEFYMRADYEPLRCEKCTEQRRLERERKNQQFEGRTIKVMVLKDGELPPKPGEEDAAKAAAAAAAAEGKRRSSRQVQRATRSTKKGDVKNVEHVNSTDTVTDMLLKIYQAIQLEDGKNILLYFNGEQLKEGNKTLSQVGVRADTVLHVRVVSAEEGQQFLDCVDLGHSHKGEYRPEQGFQGTFLAQSHVPVANGHGSGSSSGNGGGSTLVDLASKEDAVVAVDKGPVTVTVDDTSPMPSPVPTSIDDDDEEVRDLAPVATQAEEQQAAGTKHSNIGPVASKSTQRDADSASAVANVMEVEDGNARVTPVQDPMPLPDDHDDFHLHSNGADDPETEVDPTVHVTNEPSDESPSRRRKRRSGDVDGASEGDDSGKVEKRRGSPSKAARVSAGGSRRGRQS